MPRHRWLYADSWDWLRQRRGTVPLLLMNNMGYGSMGKGAEGKNMTSRDDFTRAVLQIIGETLLAKDLSAQGLGLDSLVDSSLGLDSLDWAAVVVRVELETGVDPFAEGTVGTVKTVSDLIDLYVKAVG